MSVATVLQQVRTQGLDLSVVRVAGEHRLKLVGPASAGVVEELTTHRGEIIHHLSPPAGIPESIANLVAEFGKVEAVTDQEHQVLTRAIYSIVSVRNQLRDRGVSIPRTGFGIAHCPDCGQSSISTTRTTDLGGRCPHCRGWQGRDDDPMRGRRRRMVVEVLHEASLV